MTVIAEIDKVWAETGDKTVDYLSTAKFSQGFVAKDQPRHTTFNYLLNRSDSKINEIINFIDGAAGVHLSNWQLMLNDTSAADLGSVCYHPEIKKWIAVDYFDTGVEVWQSIDACKWEAGSVKSLTNGAYRRMTAIDSTRFLIPNLDNDIEYTTDLSSWNKELSATIGGSGTIYCIDTKYPSSNRTILVRDKVGVRIAATGIGGGWVASSTPPVSTNNAQAIKWVSGTTWLFLSSGGSEFHVSEDDGDTWAETTFSPYAVNFYPYRIGVNPDTGVVVLAGNGASGQCPMRRNITLGDETSWHDVVFSDGHLTTDPPYPVSSIIYDILYCGRNTWVAVGNKGSDLYGIWMSKDDGYTWRFIYARKQTTGEVTKTLHHIARSENQLIACGDDGRCLRTICLADGFGL